jgi:hypothetical protein
MKKIIPQLSVSKRACDDLLLLRLKLVEWLEYLEECSVWKDELPEADVENGLNPAATVDRDPLRVLRKSQERSVQDNKVPTQTGLATVPHTDQHWV